MNAKTKIIMGLVVIAVLVGIVTLNPRRAAEPAITATAKVAVGVNSAKVQTQVVAPLRPAAYPKDASAASVPSAISPEATSVAPRSDSDPQADLSTALPHLINLIQAGQILDAFEQYMPPSYFASMPAQIKAQLKQQEANLLADPGAAKTRERVVSVLRDMLMQMPEMDEMGDRATYRSDASQFKAAFQASQLTFVKINGQWFFAPGTEPGFF